MPDHLYEAVESVGNFALLVVDQRNLVAGALVVERHGDLCTAISHTPVVVEHAGLYKSSRVQIAHRAFTIIDKSVVS